MQPQAIAIIQVLMRNKIGWDRYKLLFALLYNLGCRKFFT